MVNIPKLKYQLDSPIQRIESPDAVQMQINGCTPSVKIDDVVKVGDLIAKSEIASEIERRIHSPLNGKITTIDHSHIDIVGHWPNRENNIADIELSSLQPEDIKEKCRLAGVVGMGGAMTPTHFKLNSEKQIDTVIVNMSESEPYLTCDHRVLIEYPLEVETGLKLAMIAVGAENGLIAPKKNDYTSGYERFLVEETLGRKVPTNFRPTDVGVLVLNLQTIYALYHAVFQDQPLMERVITVDGDAITRPGNYLVPIGTKVRYILSYCGWDENKSKQIIIGGPMMGGIADENTAITAGTGGVLALSSEQVSETKDNPCMRCGMCMAACPLGLWPGLMEREPSKELMTCIACGACQFACPAERPLLKNIEKAKTNFLKKPDSE